MQLLLQNLNQSLNKGYLKQGVTRSEINLFKTNLVQMFERIDEEESEENLKNIIADFLKDTYYKNRFEINTKDRKDLVIHHGKTAKDAVGLILEAKKPSNKAEMMTIDKPNAKALQELVLYYLREVHENKNHEIKYLIVTNIWEWYILDGVWFEQHIFRNVELKKAYENWKVSGQNTQFFYQNIAKVHLDKIGDNFEISTPLNEPLPCTYFDLRTFRKQAEMPECEEDNDLISLYKIFSPEHLLRKPFANDSNTLNTAFYFELLYILGLEEVKDGAKKVIQRCEWSRRNEGSLLENTISKLIISKKITENEEEIFSVALELCITWLNRILFLKLLEGQIIRYHQGNQDYAFLHEDKIKDFDELEELFFEVLALPVEERSEIVQNKYQKIPYLNSSLFDISELEKEKLALCQLKNRLEMPIYAQSVLKDGKGNKVKGRKNTLVYLFQFLNSYNFSQENAQIQKESKSIINAAVLGLIFEKINGYQDGSFFTPGYITMYMCRETIRKAVVQKFNEKYNWNCEDFESLKGRIDFYDKKVLVEANALINSLKICDPSVGSGHFLVSALNEIVAIKSELQVLCHKDGSRIREQKVVVEQDELLILDVETNKLFQYRLNYKNEIIEPFQILQEAIFYEKQTIIENCLFGVDINPKSVSICRLRLWIELLKSMYYVALPPAYQSIGRRAGELETLPNIDINIKVGNSLISRFSTHNTEGKTILPKERAYIKQLIDKYKVLVFAYKNVKNYHSKQDIRKQIAFIKTEFEKFSIPNDSDFFALRKKEAELAQTTFVFDQAEKERLEKLSGEIHILKQKYIQKLKSIYQNALEWRFEFPEVLDDEGNFVGFDVVVANPPYGIYFSSEFQQILSKMYETFWGRGESYILFIEKATNLLKTNGLLAFIVPDTLLNLDFTGLARTYILKNTQLSEIDLLPTSIFSDAVVDTILLFFQKNNIEQTFQYTDVCVQTYPKKEKISSLNLPERSFWISTEVWHQQGSFNLQAISAEYEILNTVEARYPQLKTFAEIFSGIKVYEVGKGNPPQTAKTRDTKPYTSSSQKTEDWMPFLDGKHIGRYEMLWKNNNWVHYGDWLAAPRNQQTFEGEKILIRKIIGSKLIANYTSETYYANTLLFILKLLPTQTNISYRTLLGILNSTFIAWYFKKKMQIVVDDTFPQIMIKDILRFPIPNMHNALCISIENAVDTLIKLKKEQPNTDTTVLENEIDQLVYQLYGLSETEIAIIEGKK